MEASDLLKKKPLNLKKLKNLSDNLNLNRETISFIHIL